MSKSLRACGNTLWPTRGGACTQVGAPWATWRVAPSAGTTLLRGGSSLYYADDLVGAGAAGKADPVAGYFGQQRQFWSVEPIEFNGNKVYQRADLFDPYLFDPKTGKTNIELMLERGRAPIGIDGKPVNLHHMTQQQNGPIAEVLQDFHKTNHSVIHINPNTIPSGIDRGLFTKWRSEYWKARANDLTK